MKIIIRMITLSAVLIIVTACSGYNSRVCYFDKEASVTVCFGGSLTK